MAVGKDSAEALSHHIMAAEYYKLRMDLPSQSVRGIEGNRTAAFLLPVPIRMGKVSCAKAKAKAKA